MSRTSFENYGKKAEFCDSETIVAGRYRIQEIAERNILFDVINKMNINGNDKLLDIGCGSGNLLIPLSFICSKVTGIGHGACINRLKGRIKNSTNIETIPKNFLDVFLNVKFDKILCYSVLHYLSDDEEVLLFISKALKLLKPGGIALFGDIPNVSLKQRFINSTSGSEFSKKWKKLIRKEYIRKCRDDLNTVEDNKLVLFDDNLVLKILTGTREKGFDSFVLDQHPDLPFGYTREDILIKYPH